MSLFTLQNIRYKNILSIPSLEIKKGKMVALYGKTGLGKTTFLKLLQNLISPDTGTIFYKNQDCTQIHPKLYRKEVMMIPQHAVIFGKTIKEDMLTGIRLHKLSIPPDETLKHTLETLELDKKLESPTKNL